MTANVPDPSTQAAPSTARPRWLLPTLIIGGIVGALVVFGILPPSAALYGALAGGMLLMHAAGHGGHGGGPTSDGANLSPRSSGSQQISSGFGHELDDRASNDPKGSEAHDHDRRSSHSCH